MALIKGITVTLLTKEKVGEDEFNRAVYDDIEIEVENVLVSPTLSNDIVNDLDFTGKTATYTLAIPKGDTHTWKDAKVKFFDETWVVFGEPTIGIEENIPLDWNKKVTVERYE